MHNPSEAGFGKPRTPDGLSIVCCFIVVCGALMVVAYLQHRSPWFIGTLSLATCATTVGYLIGQGPNVWRWFRGQ